MKQARLSTWQAYTIALVTSGLAVIITQLTPLDSVSHLLLPITAIVISAWFGGLGPGLLAIVIDLFGDMFFDLGPTLPLRLATPIESIRYALFALVSLLIVWLAAERKQTEDRLRGQRGLLRVTMESMGDAMITTDEKGQTTFMNPGAQALTGCKQPDALGKPLSYCFYLLDEKTGAPMEDLVKRVLSNGHAMAFANPSILVSKDGRHIAIDNNAAPIRDEKGKPVGAIFVFRDITEQRQTEEKLKQQAQLLDLSSDAIFAWNFDGGIVYWNEGAEKLYGYTSDEAIRQVSHQLLGTSHPQNTTAFLAALEREGEWRGELTHRTKDGRSVAIETIQQVVVQDGRKIVLETNRDITERKQAERRQRAQYAVTRALADSDTLAEAAPKILRAVCESVGWQAGALWYIDRNADVLRCVDFWHVPEIDLTEFEKLSREMLFSRSVNLPGRVWSQNGLVWITDIEQDESFTRSKVAMKENLRSAFGFPIQAGNEFTGVLEFFNQQVHSPDQALIDLLGALGSQIGQFVERKKTEEALKLSREQQAIILQGVADGITAQNLKGDLIFANDAAARLLGFSSPKELLAAPLNQVVQNFEIMDEAGDPFDLNQLPGRIALRGLTPSPVFVRFRNRQTGEERWSLVNAAPVRDERGNVQFAVSIFHDTTERRRGEENTARLAAIVESSQDAILSKTTDGIILSWNPGATQLFGYTAEEMIGKPVSHLYPADYQEESRQVLQRLNRGEPTAMHDSVRCRKDGSRVDVSVSVSPIKNAQGKTIAASTIMRDIAERKHVEETQRFLSDVSNALNSSLDYEQTLTSVAYAAVPKIADWCVVHIATDNAVQQVVVAHNDPAKIALAEEIQRRYPPDPQAPTGVHRVLKTGQTEYVFNITDEQLVASAQDVEQLKMILDIGIHSYVIAPLIARGRTLGTISFVSSDAHRHFGKDDVALFEEVARRAALSVDNARLYRQSQQLNEELEARVVQRTIELQNANRELQAQSAERKQTAEQLRLLSAHLQSAREEERIRIAREIHDQLGQSLTAVKIDVSLFGKKLADPTTELDRQAMHEEVVATAKLIDQTIQEMRHIIQELRPEILDHLGLSAAIEWQVQDFSARTGIRCRYSSSIDDSELDLDRATALFRILQESLTNVARHSGASSVDIKLRGERDNLVLEIHDNGKGIDTNKTSPGKSFGILGMRERALAFGGTVDIHSVPRQGTIVSALIPVENGNGNGQLASMG